MSYIWNVIELPAYWIGFGFLYLYRRYDSKSMYGVHTYLNSKFDSKTFLFVEIQL